MAPRTRKLIILSVTGVLAMSAGIWLASSLKQPATAPMSQAEKILGFHGTLLPTPRKLAIPALKKTDGSAFTDNDLSGHWSLLFFGYTSCPDICPTTMSTLVVAKQRSAQAFPQVYFISVDPERDKLANLSAYVKYFDEDFVGITGTEKMLGALALQTSVVFMKMPAESASENEYLMDHSSALLLINPQAQLTAFINPPHSPESILKAIRAVGKNEK